MQLLLLWPAKFIQPGTISVRGTVLYRCLICSYRYVNEAPTWSRESNLAHEWSFDLCSYPPWLRSLNWPNRCLPLTLLVIATDNCHPLIVTYYKPKCSFWHADLFYIYCSAWGTRPSYAHSAHFHLDKGPGIQCLRACRIIPLFWNCILPYIFCIINGVYYVMNTGWSQSL